MNDEIAHLLKQLPSLSKWSVVVRGVVGGETEFDCHVTLPNGTSKAIDGAPNCRQAVLNMIDQVRSIKPEPGDLDGAEMWILFDCAETGTAKSISSNNSTARRVMLGNINKSLKRLQAAVWLTASATFDNSSGYGKNQHHFGPRFLRSSRAAA